MSISCCVVSYHNPPEEIAEVLRSASATPDVALTLVDNSANDALAAVARRFGARYVHRPDNLGFGAAHNLAIREAIAQGADYHLVLNPDISFGPEVIPALRAYMDAHPDIGLIMPDIRYPDGSRQHLCKLLPHPGDLFVRRFLPALYRLSGRLDTYEMRRSGYDRIMDVPSLSGCFMFLRTSVLKKAGGFDERFFMYLEDVDLSRRIGQIARTVYYPGVSITHAYQKGSYKTSALLLRHIRSAIRYFNKWGWVSDAERGAVNRAALQGLQHAQPLPADAPSLTNRK
ncbi:MAG TPA: glycosyltransferase family 2 protein [Noviherbaspirillum sp.]|uniref:glycosyltransferase family 2 protein n=1 Tax=Noviherbaspirillum sp. TaxID=1926288 RepID=UPI002D658F93|nr:glycosyltransferase family 2 protein [Noviherbaspirillum sp.]HYD95592.1 glycosyltransferase family 2 protein [Noviherbaspirillum sp.]